MRIISSILLLFMAGFLVLSLPGCGPDDPLDPADVAIEINDIRISTQEFNELIKLQAYSDPEMSLNRESRQEYVDYLIQKELLIQEAIRLKMDRTDDFIKTIERYWESTLVNRLLEQKTEELRKKVLITEEEMEAYYVKNKDEFGQPYGEVKESIHSILESRKLAEKIESWTKGLRAAADIRVSPSVGQAKQ